jgi:hypothetical protein
MLSQVLVPRGQCAVDSSSAVKMRDLINERIKKAVYMYLEGSVRGRLVGGGLSWFGLLVHRHTHDAAHAPLSTL